MKMEEILKLIEAVSASELTDFKYEENGTKLNLKKEQQKVEIIQSPGVVPVTGTVTAGLQTAEILQNPGNEADHTQEEHQEVLLIRMLVLPIRQKQRILRLTRLQRVTRG